MSDALHKLIEAIEAGTATVPPRRGSHGDWLFFDAFPPHLTANHRWARAAYDGSLDAAKTLHEALLPGWALERLTTWPGNKSHACLWGTHEERGERWHDFKDGRVDAEADTPARAWLLAVLRAHAAQQEPAA